jgi:uncharacterized damage-inducible protein DinB
VSKPVFAATELIDTYLRGAERVAQAITGLSPHQLHAHPTAGMWSLLEVVCHLADSEALFAERMKRVLAENRPPMLFADPTRYASALAYSARDAGEEVAFIGAVRRQMARILRAQPDTAWQRVGLHSVEGERTLAQLLQKAIAHLEHHLQFIANKRRLLERSGNLEA